VFTSILADFFTSSQEFTGLGVFALNPEASFDKRMPRELAKDTVQLYHYSVLDGISTWVDALLAKIESHGGMVRTGCPVTKIVVEGARAVGVADGSGVQTLSDVVVASGGAKETFVKLVGEEHLPVEFAKGVWSIPLMDSVFMVHLGVDFDPSPTCSACAPTTMGRTTLTGRSPMVAVGFITKAGMALWFTSPACIRHRWRCRVLTP
jgi:hypothetical protein